MKIPTTRYDLIDMGVQKIAEVDSCPEDAADFMCRYTRLSLWWSDEGDRPYIAVVEGLSNIEGDDDKFRAARFGSMSSAMAFFDPSDLRNDLFDQLPDDLADRFPDANALRQKRARANRGYKGPDDLTEALAWLYEGMGMDNNNKVARAVENDFLVPWRTVTRALDGGKTTGWAMGFIRALRYLDRGAWKASREEIARG